jgi:peptide/nickel transport system ATP-binding protein/oligopeptide transport system ATP-binding protein
VLDEAVSALDVSIQAQIINLLSDLQNRLKLAYLFVAHDLGVVHHISDRVGVMFHGRLVEFGPRDSVFALPRHPHTKALLAAALSVDNAKVLPRLSGVVRDNREEDGSVAGSGCPYRFRCPFRIELCAQVTPEPVDLGGGHQVICHVAERSPSDWLAGDPVVPKTGRSEQSKHAKNPGETAHAH